MLSSCPAFKWTLRSSISLFTFVVIGQITVDKCVSFNRSVCMITTGLVFPGSVPLLGFKLARPINLHQSVFQIHVEPPLNLPWSVLTL